jgi:hypothetical protein
MLSLTGAAYLAFNLLRLGFRVPAVRRAWRGPTGTRRISLPGWAFWLLFDLGVGLWAILAASDLLLALTGFGSAVADAAIVAITVHQRRMHRRLRMRASRVVPAATLEHLIAPPTVPSYRVID